MNMKLNPNLTQQQTSDIYQHYEHPWYEHVKHRISDDCPEDMKKPVYNLLLNKPNPPSKEAVERARFVDKTYHWKGGGDSVRSGGERTTK